MFYRYQKIQPIKSSDISTFGNQYYVNNIYPDIPISDTDQYVITVLGDRLDLLAQDIYGDVSLWWILASANSLPGDSLVPPIGAQLRIPSDIQSIVNSYDSINRTR
jgi:hypothetical protein